MRRKNKIAARLILTAILALSFASFDVSPAKAAGASLYLAPATGTFVINGKFNVAVRVNSGGQEINAAEGSLSFDASLLEVAGISKGGTIFPFWTAEPSFNNGSGAISFGGGMPPPAYKGSAGQIFTISFKAKKAGTAAVRFTSGAVLANDGKGTNVLASMGSASYVISPKVEAPADAKEEDKPEAPKIEAEYNLPKIESPSHPDPNAWYNKNKVELKWALPAGVSGVSFMFDEKPLTEPGQQSDGLLDSKVYENVADGMHYFHLKFKDAKRWGTTAHFRVLVDTAPPDPFTVEVKKINVGEWPELIFESVDKLSGLGKYEVHVGSLEEQAHELKAEDKGIKLSDLSVGEHTAIIRAIDKAGNERSVTVHFTIDPIDAPVITGYPQAIKATDNFYISGTALPSADIAVYIEGKDKEIIEEKTKADQNGNWFFVRSHGLPNGRYVAWATAANENGIKSNPSSKVSFLVSPPIFAVVGSLVINYFTVFVSLLFVVVLIALIIAYIFAFVRRKLKKETLEVEDIIMENASALKAEIEKDFSALSQFEGKKSYSQEKARMKDELMKKIDDSAAKSLKEIRDVEKILK